jgi:hypothetical protein
MYEQGVIIIISYYYNSYFYREIEWKWGIDYSSNRNLTL